MNLEVVCLLLMVSNTSYTKQIAVHVSCTYLLRQNTDNDLMVDYEMVLSANE